MVRDKRWGRGCFHMPGFQHRKGLGIDASMPRLSPEPGIRQVSFVDDFVDNYDAGMRVLRRSSYAKCYVQQFARSISGAMLKIHGCNAPLDHIDNFVDIMKSMMPVCDLYDAGLRQ